MKNQTNQPPNLYNFSPETLEEIQSMRDLDHDGFLAYSRAIDNVFFEYMIFSVADPVNNLGITSTDIYCIHKVKRLLELLQKTVTENQTT